MSASEIRHWEEVILQRKIDHLIERNDFHGISKDGKFIGTKNVPFSNFDDVPDHVIKNLKKEYNKGWVIDEGSPMDRGYIAGVCSGCAQNYLCNKDEDTKGLCESCKENGIPVQEVHWKYLYAKKHGYINVDKIKNTVTKFIEKQKAYKRFEEFVSENLII